MPKVLITPVTLQGNDGPFLELLCNAGFDVASPGTSRALLEDELQKELAGMSAVIAGAEPFTAKVMDANPQLRVIARSGVGYDAVDVPAATERNIAVTITPGTNQDSVAEHTFALILGCAKNIINQHFGTLQGKWPRAANVPLRGRTLGIAGLGRIGKAVAIRGAAFKMKLLAYEPFPDHEFAKQYGIEFVPFEQLLQESDFLSIHVPLTSESKYLINKETLALMKPTAYLINTARGGLVCEKDLLDALNNKQIAGAGLDVFELEPPILPHALLEHEKVVLTPHAAGVDLQSRDDMATAAAQAIIALSRGEWPAEQVVNGEIKERFKW